MAITDRVDVVIEINDRIGIVDGLQAILNGLKEIDTQVEVDGSAVQWDISKNAPGYRVIMRDEGVGSPSKFIVRKADGWKKEDSGTLKWAGVRHLLSKGEDELDMYERTGLEYLEWLVRKKAEAAKGTPGGAE